MFWIRLSNSACESRSLHRLFCVLQRLGCFSAARLQLIYAVDCLSTRLESPFPEHATQGKDSSNNMCSRRLSAAASFISRHAERSLSPLSPALFTVELSSQCVAPSL